MRYIRFSVVLLAAIAMCLCSCHNVVNESSPKIIVAYVTAGGNMMPDPAYVTHVNYAFGNVNKSFNGIDISNPNRLRSIVAIKEKAPQLKVILSIGGWTSGGFSEMAATDKNRKAFAADCGRIVKEFGLDGIDMDWEYPTSSESGISSSPEDTKNFTLLMHDIRHAIGKEKLLTLATIWSGLYVDFKAIDDCIDFVNLMTYDMGWGPTLHSALYRSENGGRGTCEESVNAHLAAGVPRNKIVLGMPFYGKGELNGRGLSDYRRLVNQTEYKVGWDDVAKVPYMMDNKGVIVGGFENPRSIAIKCRYILDQQLLGAMYWEYDCDTEDLALVKTVFNSLNK